jgi:transporter family protein
VRALTYNSPMSWFPLALATAVTFGLYNFFIKLGAGRIDEVLGALVLQAVALLAGGGFAVALRLQGRGFAVTRAGLGYAALAGVAVGLAEILSFSVFSRGAPASLGTPVIMGGSVVCTALLGLVLLRETPSVVQLAGIALVAAGIALVSVGRAH